MSAIVAVSPAREAGAFASVALAIAVGAIIALPATWFDAANEYFSELLANGLPAYAIPATASARSMVE